MTAPAWSPPPPDVRLVADVVDVWRADLGARADAVSELLAPDEQARAARFARAELGRRWAHARGILRALLGRYAGADPAQLRFAAGPHGKPMLSDGSIRFNLSHSGDVALFAFALDREVGVDVELPRRSFDVERIAERTFGAAEAARLRALPPPQREREFLRAWVRYEAVLKCHGTGIAGAEASTEHRPEPWLQELDAGPLAAAALAVEGPASEVRCWRWPPPAA